MTPVKPTGGTFSVTYRHGRSDPVPYNASAAVVREASDQAGRRDEVITAAHRLDAAAFAACAVCNPPIRAYAMEVPWRRRWRNWRERVVFTVYNWLEGRR